MVHFSLGEQEKVVSCSHVRVNQATAHHERTIDSDYMSCPDIVCARVRCVRCVRVCACACACVTCVHIRTTRIPDDTGNVSDFGKHEYEDDGEIQPEIL